MLLLTTYFKKVDSLQKFYFVTEDVIFKVNEFNIFKNKGFNTWKNFTCIFYIKNNIIQEERKYVYRAGKGRKTFIADVVRMCVCVCVMSTWFV